jgi:hypothetical protein
MGKTMVWSVVLYGSETRTMRKDDTKRLEVFKMWIWSRMERVSWREHKTNEEILQKVERKDPFWRQYKNGRENGLATS